MARKPAPRAWKLTKWADHHEPKRWIGGPLGWYRIETDRGSGIDRMMQRYTASEVHEAIGVFDRLQKMTARLERHLRSWVLTAGGRPATASDLARELGYDRDDGAARRAADAPPGAARCTTDARPAHDGCAPDARSAQTQCTGDARVLHIMRILEHGKWLKYMVFRPSRKPSGAHPSTAGEPPGALRPRPRAKTPSSQDRDRDADRARRRAGPEVSPPDFSGDQSSPSVHEGPPLRLAPGSAPAPPTGPVTAAPPGGSDVTGEVEVLGTLVRTIGIRLPSTLKGSDRLQKQAQANLTVLRRCIYRHRDDPARLEELCRHAREVATSTGVKNKMAVWTDRIKAAGHWYEQTGEQAAAAAE